MHICTLDYLDLEHLWYFVVETNSYIVLVQWSVLFPNYKSITKVHTLGIFPKRLLISWENPKCKNYEVSTVNTGISSLS